MCVAVSLIQCVRRLPSVGLLSAPRPRRLARKGQQRTSCRRRGGISFHSRTAHDNNGSIGGRGAAATFNPEKKMRKQRQKMRSSAVSAQRTLEERTSWDHGGGTVTRGNLRGRWSSQRPTLAGHGGRQSTPGTHGGGQRWNARRAGRMAVAMAPPLRGELLGGRDREWWATAMTRQRPWRRGWGRAKRRGRRQPVQLPAVPAPPLRPTLPAALPERYSRWPPATPTGLRLRVRRAGSQRAPRRRRRARRRGSLRPHPSLCWGRRLTAHSAGEWPPGMVRARHWGAAASAARVAAAVAATANGAVAKGSAAGRMCRHPRR